MVDLDQFRQTLFDELDDCLNALEVELTAFQDGKVTKDRIEEAFRAIHSIKGGAGTFSFERIISVSHEMETVLDHARGDTIKLTEDITDTLLHAFDVLTSLIQGERDGKKPKKNLETKVLAELTAVLSGLETNPADEPVRVAETAMASGGEGWPDGLKHFQISFRPSATMLQRGIEPIGMIRELKSCGDLDIQVDSTALPALEALDPTLCYLSWTLTLATDTDRSEIEEIFEFVEDDCDLAIQELGPDQTGPSARDGIEDAALEITPLADPESAPQNTSEVSAVKSIRVELDRVDRMVNIVGEIVISHAAILQHVDEALARSHPGLVADLQQFYLNAQSLQDSVMAIRAQPVKSIFDRMPRLVRELSQQTGKKVRLVTRGEETEIDKTVIEKLADPLTHMIRNSVDHGIESPERRIAAGKPETGTLTLRASQVGNQIVIELSDDGKGLDRAAIRKKAIEAGLILADEQLSEPEIDNLIFKAGFSTASTISNISGRGVGMDVVNENIRNLGGRASIRSDAGIGSTVTLTLPLTLAVIEGMVVRIGASMFVIPLTSIIESIALTSADTNVLSGIGEVYRFRGQYIRINDLHGQFGFAHDTDSINDLLMVIEAEAGRLVGLRVDEIVGQQQVVVKNIEHELIKTPHVAGGSIMGNGQVALILNTTALSGRENIHSRESAAQSVEQPENL